MQFYSKHQAIIDYLMLVLTATVTAKLAVTVYFDHLNGWEDSISVTLWVFLGIIGSLAAFFAVKLIFDAIEIYRDDPYRRHRKRPWIS